MLVQAAVPRRSTAMSTATTQMTAYTTHRVVVDRRKRSTRVAVAKVLTPTNQQPIHFRLIVKPKRPSNVVSIQVSVLSARSRLSCKRHPRRCPHDRPFTDHRDIHPHRADRRAKRILRPLGNRHDASRSSDPRDASAETLPNRRTTSRLMGCRKTLQKSRRKAPTSLAFFSLSR